MMEAYKYIEKTLDNVHVFLHEVENEEMFSKYGFQLDFHVMNCMVHEKRIKSYNDKIVIFTLNPFRMNLTASVIRHVKDDTKKFDITKLINMFNDLVASERRRTSNDKRLVLVYIQEKGIFEFIDMTFRICAGGHFYIEGVKEYLTSIPISYL